MLSFDAFFSCTVKGWKMKSLCSTLGQRNIQQLSFKTKSSSSKRRATVVVLARIHPGEPVGSWAVEGMTRSKHSPLMSRDHSRALNFCVSRISTSLPLMMSTSRHHQLGVEEHTRTPQHQLGYFPSAEPGRYLLRCCCLLMLLLPAHAPAPAS